MGGEGRGRVNRLEGGGNLAGDVDVLRCNQLGKVVRSGGGKPRSGLG